MILGPILLPIWVYWSICSQFWLKWSRVQTEIFSCHLTHETDDFNTLEWTTDIANMLSLLWPLCLSPLFKQTWFSASRSYLNQLVAYSLLEHLIIVTNCVFKYFRSIWKLEKVYGPPGAQPEISSKEGWEKHTIFGQKHTLFGRQEGGGAVARALTKKIDPG